MGRDAGTATIEMARTDAARRDTRAEAVMCELCGERVRADEAISFGGFSWLCPACLAGEFDCAKCDHTESCCEAESSRLGSICAACFQEAVESNDRSVL